MAVALPLGAQIGNVRVNGVTATQAVISYTAPDAAACSVRLSEKPDLGAGYQPVNDVNAGLFPGADRDDRPGSIPLGRARVFVAGKRVVERAADGRKYSRALQNETVHYYQIRCGSQVAAGSFGTRNIGFGSTHGEAMPTDPASTTGFYNYPDLNYSDRTEKVIDPLTGTEIRKVSLAEEFSESKVNQAVGAATGTNWTNPAGVTVADGAPATYSGTARDILYVPTPYAAANGTNLLNRLNLDLMATISGSPAGDDKYIDICITKDGTNCVSPWKAVDVTTCAFDAYQGECDDAGSTRDVDFWGGEPFHGWVQAAKRGVLIRPRTTSANYTISIDHIRYTVKSMGQGATFPASSGYPSCSSAPITDDGDGHTYYLCLTISAQRMYSIDVTEGQAYYLGPILGVTSPAGVIFDETDGRSFYSIQSGSGKHLLKGTWSSAPGAMRVEHKGTFQEQPANLTWTNLTPDGYTLNELTQAFDARFDAEWQSYVNGVTNRWGLISAQNGKLVGLFTVGQNRQGWLVAFDPAAAAPAGSSGQGNIVAAYPVGRTNASRYCTIHSTIGQSGPWFTIGNGRYTRPDSGYGGGPWQVKVRKPGGGDLAPTDTVFELVAFNGTTEPTDPTPSGKVNDLTIPAEPGDLFYFENGTPDGVHADDELIEIVSIDRSVSPPRWTVRRSSQLLSSPFWPTGYTSTPRSTTPYTIPEGSILESTCRSLPLNRDNDNGSTYWNFEADPRGNTLVLPASNGAGVFPPGPGTYAADSGYASPQTYLHWNHGSHGHTRIDQGVKLAVSGPPDCTNPHNTWSCWAIQRGESISLLEQNPVAYQSSVIPPFAGQVPGGIVGSYQSHPNFLQTLAAPVEKRWETDMLPLHQAGTNYGGTVATAAEAGTTTVFKVTGTMLKRRHFGTLAKCGERVLRDVSSATQGNVISDATPYSYCVANADGECREGSKAGEVYVSCPGKTGVCANAVFAAKYPSTTVDVCVANNWAFGHGIVQVPLTSNSIYGERTRLIAYPFPIPHLQSEYAASKPLPDGRWAVVLVHRHERPDLFLVKIPPYPAEDSVSRGSFVNVPVTVKPPAGLGVDNAVVEFGYAENGAPEAFHCTTRREACLATGEKIDQAAPFVFASQLTAGAPCASGCTVAVPALTRRVVYYRVKYRNAGNEVVSTGTLQAVASP